MRPAPFLFAALLMTSCTDLAAVRSISGTLTQASSSWTPVAGELVQSCHRKMQFNALLRDCDAEASAVAGTVAVNTVLGAYFEALFDAADESKLTIQPGLDRAAASAAKVPGINVDQVQAVSGLVGLLARLATEAAREAVLRKLIGEGAPLAKSLVAVLAGAVPPALDDNLASERTLLSSKFVTYIQSQQGRVSPPLDALCEHGPATEAFSGGNFMLLTDYCRRIAALDEKVTALAQYRASLASADKALDELSSSRTRLGSKALAFKLYGIAREMNDDIAAVRTAFAKGAA